MAAALLATSCSDDKQPSINTNYTQSQWGETMSGNKLVQYPDLYSNYWEFTWNTEPAIALQLPGEFPHARYFSLSLYNDNTGDVLPQTSKDTSLCMWCL